MPEKLPHEELAMKLLDCARQNLETDGHVIPVVFVINDRETKINAYIMEFSGRDEKYQLYQSLWAKILPENPAAIIMINDSYTKTLAKGAPMPKSMEAARESGDLEVRDCINMIVYPRGSHSWGTMSVYTKEPLVFEPVTIMRNESGTELAGHLGPEPWNREANRTIKEKIGTPVQ